jgi:hypothetical protein
VLAVARGSRDRFSLQFSAERGEGAPQGRGAAGGAAGRGPGSPMAVPRSASQGAGVVRTASAVASSSPIQGACTYACSRPTAGRSRWSSPSAADFEAAWRLVPPCVLASKCHCSASSAAFRTELPATASCGSVSPARSVAVRPAAREVPSAPRRDTWASVTLASTPEAAAKLSNTLRPHRGRSLR